MAPVAIVTGACSGIGLSLTRRLVSRGWNVAMADVDIPTGEALSAELGPVAMFQPTDVSSWDDQAALFKRTKEAWGRIDYVAANAGIDEKQNFYKVDDHEPVKPDLKVIEVNLISVIYGLRLAAHYFRQNGKEGGAFVATSSAAGIYPLSVEPLYASAKSGIVNLIRSTASTYAKENITVNCVCPAFVPTSLPPAKLKNAWPEEHITPPETIVRAFENFLNDRTLTGKVAECSLDQIFYREIIDYPNESQRWVNEESSHLWDAAYGME
ncbi:MAG: hypothetical protein M1837_002657 [Sclerophora amabilis]|nr:MAG: hypothetical protein M1837_002657 [Sclerophora amabilis]